MQEKICPKCRFPSMKNWEELDDEQKMLVERLPLSAEYSRAERRHHRFCPRCWHEETGKNNIC